MSNKIIYGPTGSNKSNTIDLLEEFYRHDGVRIKNPKDYQSVYCTTCKKLVGWSPYSKATDYVIYCKKCGEGVMEQRDYSQK